MNFTFSFWEIVCGAMPAANYANSLFGFLTCAAFRCDSVAFHLLNSDLFSLDALFWTRGDRNMSFKI